jgi:hypothetical protein
MIYLYFFIGQAITYNFAHFAVSLITLVLCHLIIWLATGIDELYLGTVLYAGWLSVVLIPELFLQIQDILTRISNLQKHLNFTFYILLFELIIFIAISIFIIDYEYSTWHWFYLLVVHAIYNSILTTFGSNLPIGEDKTQPQRYYWSWFYVILLTDIVFLLISCIEFNSLSTHIALMFTFGVSMMIIQFVIKFMEQLGKQ